MRKSYSVEDLHSYLLGVAATPDAEQMDELSVTDNEFADLLGATEKDLIDSYVQGELAAEKVRRFEEYYLSSPLRRGKVQFAQAFREYSDEKSLEAHSGLETESAEHKQTSFLTRLSGFGRLLSAPTLAVAAAVVAVTILFAWLAVREPGKRGVEVATNINNNADVRQSPSPSVTQPSPAPSVESPQDSPQPTPAPPSPTPNDKIQTLPIIATFVLKPPLRGTSVTEVRIPPTATRASARLELESNDFASYSVELVNASGVMVWRAAKIKPRNNKVAPSLDLTIPAEDLAPSLYTFRVSGIATNGASEIIGDYPFRVVR